MGKVLLNFLGETERKKLELLVYIYNNCSITQAVASKKIDITVATANKWCNSLEKSGLIWAKVGKYSKKDYMLTGLGTCIVEKLLSED